MAFERATPPALRWVLAFLGLCAVLGVWLGFKDQIRRNPPAWYTGAPDPASSAAPAGPGDIREATAFDPNARTSAPRAETAPAAPRRDVAEVTAETDADAATIPAAAATTAPPATPSAATPTAPAAPRPRPAPPPTRPAPSDDPVGDLLDGPRPPPQQPPPDVPY